MSTRELVAAFRSTERPSEAAKERMARALAAAVPAPRAATVIPLRPPRRRGRTMPGGWLAVAAALLLIGASSYWLVSTQQRQAKGPADLLMAPQDADPTGGTALPRQVEPERATKPVIKVEAASVPDDRPVMPVPEAASEPAEPPIAETIVEATPRKPTRSQSRPPATERTPTGQEPQSDPVLAELVLIQKIKDALDADQPAAALAAIEAHAREFVRGSLAEEREALRVVALCDAGERARGERAREAFLRAYPRSAYRERVRAACPLAAPPETTTTID
ncbi:hypothetical protein [Nannocystis sp. SCPEA4]|uniref:hypothetical protein n=1 Tax=Nannocystis sp. SCPEA4 TaxID=2996787 RepID=UPI00226D8BF4|nr:hypothetical protein [Nannocystis sp. SCPEA4]MCY1060849.1 hypothetical protein [Nannocystis sp. SCPEA4]